MKNEIKKLRHFGLTVGIVVSLIAIYLYWTHSPYFYYLLSAGLFLILSGLIAPKILFPLNWIWMKIAFILGWIMTRVLLILLYYLVVTPIGLLLKIFGKKLLELKWDKSANSYWNQRENVLADKMSYKNQY